MCWYGSCFIKQSRHASRVLETVMILLVFHSPLWSTDLFSPSSQKVGLCIIMLVGERKEVNTRLRFHILYRCLVRLTLSTLDKPEEMRWAERPKDMKYYFSMAVDTYTQSVQGCESGSPAATSKNRWLCRQWAYSGTKQCLLWIWAFLFSLQLCRQFHTRLKWLLSSAQRRLTGSEKLVRMFSFLAISI